MLPSRPGPSSEAAGVLQGKLLRSGNEQQSSHPSALPHGSRTWAPSKIHGDREDSSPQPLSGLASPCPSRPLSPSALPEVTSWPRALGCIILLGSSFCNHKGTEVFGFEALPKDIWKRCRRPAPQPRRFGFVTLSVRTLPARGKPRPGHGPTAPCPAELAPPGTSPSGQRGVPKGHHRQVKGQKVPRETGDFGVDLAGHGDAGGRPLAAPQVQRPSPETLCSHPERGFYTSCEETCLIIYI